MKDISFPRLIAEACLVCGDLPQGERGVSGFGGLNQLGGERQAEEMVAHVTIRLGSEGRSISIYLGPTEKKNKQEWASDAGRAQDAAPNGRFPSTSCETASFGALSSSPR